jgi:hypothetical protein
MSQTSSDIALAAASTSQTAAKASLFAKFNRLPRVQKWLVYFLLAIAAYFGIEWILDRARIQAAAVQVLQTQRAERMKMAEQSASGGGLVERSIVAFGAPSEPLRGSDPVDRLNRTVDELLRKHSITAKRRTSKPASPLAVGQNAAEFRGQRLMRYQLDLTIETTTPKFLALLKDMESSPNLAGIASIRMQKIAESGKTLSDSTLMQILLVPELWAISTTGGRGVTPPPPADEAPPSEAAPAASSSSTSTISGGQP